MDERILQEQIDYYRARAAEYDEWFYRHGRCDHGEADNQQWTAEADQVQMTPAFLLYAYGQKV